MLHSLFHSFVTVYFLRATAVTWEGVGWQQSQKGEIFNGWLLRVAPLESKSARALSTQKRCWRALGKSTFLREIEFLAAEIFCFQFWQKSETGRSPTRKKNHPSDNFYVWGPFFLSKIKRKKINRQCWVCNVQITRRRWCPGTRRRRWTTPTRPTPFQTSGSRCRPKCLRPSRKSRHRLRRRPEQLRRPFHLRWRRRRPSAARSTRSTRARRRSRGSRREPPSDPSTSIKNQTCPLVSL